MSVSYVILVGGRIHGRGRGARARAGGAGSAPRRCFLPTFVASLFDRLLGSTDASTGLLSVGHSPESPPPPSPIPELPLGARKIWECLHDAGKLVGSSSFDGAGLVF